MTEERIDRPAAEPPAALSPTYAALPVLCAVYAELPSFRTYTGLARLAATPPDD